MGKCAMYGVHVEVREHLVGISLTTYGSVESIVLKSVSLCVHIHVSILYVCVYICIQAYVHCVCVCLHVCTCICPLCMCVRMLSMVVLGSLTYCLIGQRSTVTKGPGHKLYPVDAQEEEILE